MLLQKRSNGIFYFRWVYPPALRKLLGKRELIKSLHTTSKSQALARAGAHYMAVEKLKAIYLSLSADKSAWTKAFRAREDFFDRNPEGSDEIDQLSAVKQVLEECYDSDVPRYSRALLDLAEVYKPASLSEVQRKKELISSRLKLHREASTNLQGELPCGGSIKQELANLFSESICDPYEDEDFENLEFNSANREKAQNLVEPYIFFGIGNFYYLFWSYPELAATYLRDMEQVLFAYYSKMESNLCASRREPELPSFLRAKDAHLPLVVAASTESASIKFSELYAQFLTHKKSEVNLSDKMQGDYNDYVKTFLFAVGDKPISTINKKQIKEFLQGYQKLPRRNLKAYKYEPIETLWGLAVPEEHRIATRTMTSAKKFLSGVFRFAVNQGYLTESPVVDLALKTKLEKRRGNFTDLEVRKIFDVLNGDSHIQKNEWQKWAVLFGAYASLAEVTSRPERKWMKTLVKLLVYPKKSLYCYHSTCFSPQRS